jgi:acyl-homoserine-lactone acylase
MLSLALFLIALQPAPEAELARWDRHVAQVKIARDDWGIAHITGKTDADAVFGMIYAQAEDDFPRIEANYLTYLGRTAEAEGESKVYQDLRQKLYVQPAKVNDRLGRWTELLSGAASGSHAPRAEAF